LGVQQAEKGKDQRDQIGPEEKKKKMPFLEGGEHQTGK